MGAWSTNLAYYKKSEFIPPEPSLSLLSQCIGEQTVAFEPYRNPIEIDKIQDGIIKSLQIQWLQGNRS
jgi:hypothetical protein